MPPKGADEGAGFGFVRFPQGGFRRLRAASFFLDAQKEAKEAPGKSSKWALRAHIRLPLDPITGDAPLLRV